jgi:ribosomal protein L11 methyltransferase
MTISNKPTSLVSLVCDEITAKRVANLLGESLEAGETAVAAFEGTDGRWSVEVHFEVPPDEGLIRDLVTQAADAVTAAALVFDTVEARDWVATSLAGLKPVQAGRFTIHGQHDRAAVGPSRIGIEIEAALAFGTGHHGTTRGCLLALDALIKERRPRRVLDIGTGTGVLAMAAAKALRQPVLATDIDPEAVRVARENTHLNGIAPLVTCLRAAGLTDGRIRARAPFDLIFANILLPPLKRLAHGIAGIMAPDGRVVLSGLLATQEAAALAAYRAQGLSLIRRIPLDEWVTLVLAR